MFVPQEKQSLNESSAKFRDKKRRFTAQCSNFTLVKLNCLPCDLRDLSFI